MTDDDFFKCGSMFDLRMKYPEENKKIYKFTESGLVRLGKLILKYKDRPDDEPLTIDELLKEVWKTN